MYTAFKHQLPSSLENFGFGIHAVSSGFGVYALSSNITDRPCSDPCIEYRRSTFNGLGHGIYVMTLDKNRPYSVYNADFTNCFRGLTSVSTTGGTILHNNFNLGQVPDENFSYGQIGAEFHFDHNGFVLQENKFEVTEEETEVISIGLLCHKLGAFDNEIRRDSFINLHTANQAFGENADSSEVFPRGLLYLCNINENTAPYGYDFHIPGTPDNDIIHPFQTPGSSLGSIAATGNRFGYSANDFINLGDGSIIYWYFPQGYNEEPRDSFTIAINPIEGTNNTCNQEYCAPPCFEDIGLVKEEYYSNISRHNSAYDTYLTSIQQNLPDKIEKSRSTAIFFRRAASHNAYDVVTHLMIDTLNYSIDSLIVWIGFLDTYGSDLQIAGEYASQHNFVAALNVLETSSQRRSLTLRELSDLDQVIEIYNLLLNGINSISQYERNIIRNIAYSNTGQSACLARAILSKWREYIPLPYYHNQQINFRRNNGADSISNSLISNLNILSVFPNPAQNNITIKWDRSIYQPEFIYLFNSQGILCKNISITTETHVDVQVDDFSDGLYYVLSSNYLGEISSAKVIVIK